MSLANAQRAFHSFKRDRDKVLGLSILVAAFLLSMAISLAAKRASEPERVSPPDPPSAVGLIGFPNAVDPVQGLIAARAKTRRSILRGFVVEGAKSDGTVDVSRDQGSVRYSFQSSAGQGPQPPRVPGQVPRRNLCGRQSVHLRKAGLYAEADQPEVACSNVPLEPLPPPRCTLKQIWQHALKRGISEHRLARVEYYRSTAGPAWRFEIPETTTSFSVYGDCERQLSRAEAAGGVP